jgi:apolipoprotein N-acyltransferase
VHYLIPQDSWKIRIKSGGTFTRETNRDQVIPATWVFLFLTVVSALLVTASLPPFDFGIFAWFGLSPLIYALRGRSLAAAAGLGWLFGLCLGTGSFIWLPGVEGINFSKFLVCFVSVFSLYYLLFGFFYRLISPAVGPWSIVVAPALWIALEYLRANFFFLALPWNLLGHSQYLYLPVIQIADLTGVYGISFLVVMVNQWLSQVPDLFTGDSVASEASSGSVNTRNLAVQLMLSLAMLGLTFFYGWYNLEKSVEGRHLRVAVVQGNVLARDNMSVADQAKHLEAYNNLTLKAAVGNPTLIVWPATSLPGPMNSNRLVRLTIQQLARDSGAYLLVGGAGHEKFGPRKEGYLPFSNSEFLVAPSGRLLGQYNKIKLLPFNEYLPLQKVVTWPRWITRLEESFIPGDEHTLFQVSGVKFGTPICWENMFPGHFRRFVREGAQFMVSVTNEGFMGRSGGPYQTLAITAFRAVENRIAIVRAAPTGVSAFINPDGEIVDQVGDGSLKDLLTSGTLIREVPLSNQKTFYTMFGDIFAYIGIGLVILILLGALSRQKWLFHYMKGSDNES